MVLYGLGTTIGAGIYALVGTVAGTAGTYAPVAFLLASMMAAGTAFSFAELSSRYPKSAGEAVYVREGLGIPVLGNTVGMLVALAGCVSSATILKGFAGYFGELVHAPGPMILVAGGTLLGLIAAWGIRESVTMAGLVTILEIAGLLLIIWVGRNGLMDISFRWTELIPPVEAGPWSGILAASILAFYAFLGFEDMVNVAEEVKDVRRNLPVAIIITLVLTTLLYAAIAAAAVLNVPPEELGTSTAPLALVYRRATGNPATLITIISMFAMLNGALIQVIMASRVLYGLADQKVLPGPVGYIHPRTRTPVVSTGIVTTAIIVLALWFPLAVLAHVTSVIALMVFTLVNLALWRLKRIAPAPEGVMVFPAWIPVAGFAVSLGFVVYGIADLVTT